MMELETSIREMQEQFGITKLQEYIDNGTAWFDEKWSVLAQDALEEGVCFLPDQYTWDYHSNRIPKRSELAENTIGTLDYCVQYYCFNEYEDVMLDIQNYIL
jgi:hypothetical protein